MHDEVQCQGMHDLWHCCPWSQVIACSGSNKPLHGKKKNAFDALYLEMDGNQYMICMHGVTLLYCMT
jgi:hypothetical protein